jgi:hypothetical protein
LRTAHDRFDADAQVVVVLTDGFTPWPSAPLVATRIIAALVGSDPPAPPGWIEAIRVAAP